MQSARPLLATAKGADRLNAEVSAVLKAMLAGAALHLHYSRAGSDWRLSEGAPVKDQVACFGFSFHEIAYKKRLGTQPSITRKFLAPGQQPEELPSSDYDDGRIGWRRLPIRGQETILKWFFDPPCGGVAENAPPLFSLEVRSVQGAAWRGRELQSYRRFASDNPDRERDRNERGEDGIAEAATSPAGEVGQVATGNCRRSASGTAGRQTGNLRMASDHS